MTKINDLKRIRTHDDAIAFARSHGCEICNGGRHTKIIGPHGGMVPVPRHKGDLATGTRCSIIKALAAIIGVLMMLAWMGGI